MQRPTLTKRIACAIGAVRAWPVRFSYTLLRPLLGDEKALRWCGEAVARLAGDLGVYTRAAFYRGVGRRRGGSIGESVTIGFMSVLSKAHVTIGHRVYIGRYSSVGMVDIGDDAKVGDGVHLLSGGHQHAAGDQAVRYQRISIGARAWIGANAVVMADVGDDAIVGAGAVVTRPVPAGATVVGVPAKRINEGQDAIHKHRRAA